MSLGAIFLHNASTATLVYNVASADLSSVDASGRAAIVLKPATRKHAGAQDTASLAAFAQAVLGTAVSLTQVASDAYTVDAPKPSKAK